MLREHTKVNKSHVDTLMNLIKEKESDLLSRTGQHSSSQRTTQDKSCFICNSSDHIKRDCKEKCKHCGKTGHKHNECFQNNDKSKDKEKSKARSKSRPKKTSDTKKKKPDSKTNRLDSDSKDEKNNGVESEEEKNKGGDDVNNRRLMLYNFSSSDIQSTVRRLAEADKTCLIWATQQVTTMTLHHF